MKSHVYKSKIYILTENYEVTHACRDKRGEEHQSFVGCEFLVDMKKKTSFCVQYTNKTYKTIYKN